MTTRLLTPFWLAITGLICTAVCALLISGVAREAKDIQNEEPSEQLRQILLSARMFTMDGEGRFPHGLDELKGKFIRKIPRYRCEDGSFKDYVYIGGFTDTDDWRMAVIASPVPDKLGNRLVGNLLGKVMRLPAAEVEKMLTKSREFLKNRQ